MKHFRNFIKIYHVLRGSTYKMFRATYPSNETMDFWSNIESDDRDRTVDCAWHRID